MKKDIYDFNTIIGYETEEQVVWNLKNNIPSSA